MIRRSPIAGAVVVLGAASLVLAACGGSSSTSESSSAAPASSSAAPSSSSAEPAPSTDCKNTQLKIGTLLPATGSLAYLGPPEFAGFDLAIADINAAGGVLGRRRRLPAPMGVSVAGAGTGRVSGCVCFR